MSRDNGRLWDDVCDEAIRYIELKADDRDIRDNFLLELRRSYADLMGKDGWRSRVFNDLVDGIVAGLREVEREHGRSGDREADIIELAVVIYVDGHFASQVLADRKLSDDLSDEVFNGMKKALRTAEDVASASDDRDRRGRRDRDDRDDDRRGSRRNSRDRDDRDDRGSRYRTRSSRDREDRSKAGDSAGSHWDVLDALDDDRRDRDRDDEERNRTRDEDRDYDERNNVADVPEFDHRDEVHPPSNTNHIKPAVDGPDYSLAHPHDEFWRKGERYQAAHLSKWRPTYDGHNLLSTVPSVYDINTHVKYYVMDESGAIREELVEVTEDTRQLAHQLREEAVDRPDGPRNLSAGVSLLNRGEGGVLDNKIGHQQVGQSLSDLIEQIPSEQLGFAKADTIDSLRGAVFSSQAKLLADDGLPRVDVHILRTPIIARNAAQIGLVDKVYDSVTLTECADKLLALKPEFDKPVYEMLNHRFGTALLRTAKFQFQFDEVENLNFAKHYGRFLQEYRSHRSDEEAAAFAKRITYVSDLACGHVRAEEVSALAQDLLGDVENINAVVFLDIIAMASFDVSLDDLGIGKQLDANPMGMAIEKVNNGNLYTAIRSLYSNMMKELPGPLKGRLMLSTSDNRLVEVLPFAATLDAFILATVQI